MKKTILLLLLTIGSIIANAQSIHRVTHLQPGVYNETTKSWKWGKTEEVTLKITLNGNNVYVNDEAQTHITTYEDLGEKKGIDDEGDSYTLHTWKAVDEKQRKCLFLMTFYKNISFEVYSVIYSDFGFRYYISKTQLDKFTSTL